ncbi:MAG: AI-2E family transporter [Clostridia bacterium]|nr:AI-2E family transporter [Clostridia bacterium]
MLVVLQNLSSVGHALHRVYEIVFPFVLGGAIAFIFNVPLNAIENGLLKNKEFKGKRGICYLITLILILGLVVGALFLIIPRVVSSAMELAKDFQNLGNLETIRDLVVARVPQLSGPLNKLDLSYEALVNYVSKLFTGQRSILSSTVSAVTSVASGVASTLIGFAFSIYVLFAKERLGVQARKIAYALLPEKGAEKTLDVASLSYTTFSNFIKGQFLEACILGILFFLTMTLFRMPYAALCSVLIAITALIPVFGAFLGCAVSFLLILIVSPKQAVIFLVIFIVLQQIEGKLIYPHVVGSSVGLPSVWVLFAITTGAELMGVAGMLIFVPLCSVLYALFREFIHGRLKDKAVDSEKYLVPRSVRVTGESSPDADGSEPDEKKIL